MMMDNEIAGDMEELPVQPRVDVPESDLILLQRAAHAIGAVRFAVIVGEGCVNLHFADGTVVHSWNPLKFSGDALDLAVRLRLEIFIHEQDTSAIAPLITNWQTSAMAMTQVPLPAGPSPASRAGSRTDALFRPGLGRFRVARHASSIHVRINRWKIESIDLLQLTLTCPLRFQLHSV
jgi:hypothetical protein